MYVIQTQYSNTIMKFKWKSMRFIVFLLAGNNVTKIVGKSVICTTCVHLFGSPLVPP